MRGPQSNLPFSQGIFEDQEAALLEPQGNHGLLLVETPDIALINSMFDLLIENKLEQHRG